jgi:hypothetical protein
MDANSWQGPERLLREWLDRARVSQHSHHEAGKFCRRCNYLLNIPVLIITAFLGTAAFASLQGGTSVPTKIAFGSLSFAAAALTAVQTNLRLGDKSEEHKTLGARYGNVRRDIEMVLALPSEQREPPNVVLARIRSELDALSAEGDVVSIKIFERTKRALADKDAAASL